MIKYLIVLCLFISGCNLLQGESSQYRPSVFPVLTAVGYAPIDRQPAELRSEQILMAMESSKILAYRELAEQVYGLQLNSSTAVRDWSMKSSDTKILVSGLIKGARVVKTYPVDGFYVTELELDYKLVWDLYEQSESPQQNSILVIEPVQNF
ncbi:LPP20 family lipoprotein [Shewanella sp. MEBiC00475]|uniref:LPP20 family lipoprotein n=1 Tax=Shewanella sp. MEBiC00475 TaxID=2575361 RepID=UPI0010C12D1F|nr:LPP20 family lipoprotein [Shewanella sp. MEBiC00475]